MKKILCVLLAIVQIVLLVSVPAFADTDEPVDEQSNAAAGQTTDDNEDEQMPDGEYETEETEITFADIFNDEMDTIKSEIKTFFFNIFVEIPLVIIMTIGMTFLFVISAFRIKCHL